MDVVSRIAHAAGGEAGVRTRCSDLARLAAARPLATAPIRERASRVGRAESRISAFSTRPTCWLTSKYIACDCTMRVSLAKDDVAFHVDFQRRVFRLDVALAADVGLLIGGRPDHHAVGRHIDRADSLSDRRQSGSRPKLITATRSLAGPLGDQKICTGMSVRGNARMRRAPIGRRGRRRNLRAGCNRLGELSGLDLRRLGIDRRRLGAR